LKVFFGNVFYSKLQVILIIALSFICQFQNTILVKNMFLSFNFSLINYKPVIETLLVNYLTKDTNFTNEFLLI